MLTNISNRDIIKSSLRKGEVMEEKHFFTTVEMELLKPIGTLQKSILIQTERLSEQLTEKLHHLEDYNSPIDDEAIKLAEVTAEFYKLLIKSSSISAVVKEIMSEGHKH